MLTLRIPQAEVAVSRWAANVLYLGGSAALTRRERRFCFGDCNTARLIATTCNPWVIISLIQGAVYWRAMDASSDKADLAVSLGLLWQFTWGIAKRWYIWVFALILGPFEIFNTFILPRIPREWGLGNLEMPSAWGLLALILLLFGAAFLTYREFYNKTCATIRQLEHDRDRLIAEKRKPDRNLEYVKAKLREHCDLAQSEIEAEAAGDTWCNWWRKEARTLVRQYLPPEYENVFMNAYKSVRGGDGVQQRQVRAAIEWLRTKEDDLATDDLRDSYRYGE